VERDVIQIVRAYHNVSKGDNTNSVTDMAASALSIVEMTWVCLLTSPILPLQLPSWSSRLNYDWSLVGRRHLLSDPLRLALLSKYPKSLMDMVLQGDKKLAIIARHACEIVADVSEGSHRTQRQVPLDSKTDALQLSLKCDMIPLIIHILSSI